MNLYKEAWKILEEDLIERGYSLQDTVKDMMAEALAKAKVRCQLLKELENNNSITK